MVALPWAVVQAVKTAVSVNRIQRFLNCEEVDPDTVDRRVEDGNNVLELKGNLTFKGAAYRECVRNQDLNFRRQFHLG